MNDGSYYWYADAIIENYAKIAAAKAAKSESSWNWLFLKSLISD